MRGEIIFSTVHTETPSGKYKRFWITIYGYTVQNEMHTSGIATLSFFERFFTFSIGYGSRKFRTYKF